MGPLNGYTVIELAGIGPAPMGGMMLADMGAEVIRIDRAAGNGHLAMKDVSSRGKKSVVLNLKGGRGYRYAAAYGGKRRCPHRPVSSRCLRNSVLAPDTCLARNPKLVFARMTGWGQEGPLASRRPRYQLHLDHRCAVRHRHQGRKPVPPLNLVGDMGGGGVLLVTGVLAALLEATNSGKGQVIDVAMVDGAAQLMWMFHSFQHLGLWDAKQARESNMLDGGAHYYNTYECADGGMSPSVPSSRSSTPCSSSMPGCRRTCSATRTIQPNGRR